MNPGKRRIVLAITGGSGSVYGKTLLEKLQKVESPPEEIAVIFSSTGRDIWMDEIGHPFVPSGTAKEYDNNTYYAPFASGSSQYDTMIICPASMGMAGRIANGLSDNLITRAADVMLKERRKLILVPRESPYSLIHLENLRKLTLAGAIICPASPSFYSKPQSIEDLINTVVDRVMDLAGFNNHSFRWMQND
jgi:4-hydroxy-3-polyprenylbenzoate decarboxylase